MVDEAAKHERKVAAHAHGTEGIKIATRAGVASIEHGSFLDDEGARLMAQRGTYLVPTLMAGEAVERAAKDGALKGLRAEKALAAAAAMRNAIKIAAANGVPIALGTDAGVIPHGTNAHEFTLHGRVGRHDADAGDRRRHRAAPRSCSAGTTASGRSPPASWPTSSRCRATSRATSPPRSASSS